MTEEHLVKLVEIQIRYFITSFWYLVFRGYLHVCEFCVKVLADILIYFSIVHVKNLTVNICGVSYCSARGQYDRFYLVNFCHGRVKGKLALGSVDKITNLIEMQIYNNESNGRLLTQLHLLFLFAEASLGCVYRYINNMAHATSD